MDYYINNLQLFICTKPQILTPTRVVYCSSDMLPTLLVVDILQGTSDLVVYESEVNVNTSHVRLIRAFHRKITRDSAGPS